eukprot:620472-Pleurochrysis_carterae.AAC.1
MSAAMMAADLMAVTKAMVHPVAGRATMMEAEMAVTTVALTAAAEATKAAHWVAAKKEAERR